MLGPQLQAQAQGCPPSLTEVLDQLSVPAQARPPV